MCRPKLSNISIIALAVSAVVASIPTVARADIFIEDLGHAEIGEYTDSGATVNASLISDLLMTDSGGIAVSGSNVFIAQRDSTIAEYTISSATVNPDLISLPGGDFGITSMITSGSDLFVGYLNDTHTTWTVGEYTTAGAVVNASLVSGSTGDSGIRNDLSSIVVSGSNIFVWTYDLLLGGNTIAEYTTSGALVNPSLISWPGNSNSGNLIAVSGSKLFVDNDNGTIGEYTTSGTNVNPALVSGLPGPSGGIVVSGSDLFVTQGDGTVGEYTTSGATVNSDLISGLDSPWGIAIADVPEPASLSLLLLGGVSLLPRRRVGQMKSGDSKNPCFGN